VIHKADSPESLELKSSANAQIQTGIEPDASLVDESCENHFGDSFEKQCRDACVTERPSGLVTGQSETGKDTMSVSPTLKSESKLHGERACSEPKVDHRACPVKEQERLTLPKSRSLLPFSDNRVESTCIDIRASLGETRGDRHT
jgi:hypothetical protein